MFVKSHAIQPIGCHMTIKRFIYHFIRQELSHWRVKSSGVSQSKMLNATVANKGLNAALNRGGA